MGPGPSEPGAGAIYRAAARRLKRPEPWPNWRTRVVASRNRPRLSVPAASVMVLIGGFILRAVVVLSSEAIPHIGS